MVSESRVYQEGTYFLYDLAIIICVSLNRSRHKIVIYPLVILSVKLF